MNELTKKAVSSIKLNSVKQISVSVINFIKITVLARILGPNEFGLMSMVMLVLAFAKLFERLGLSDAIIQEKDPSKNELSTLYWCQLLLGIISFIIIVVLTPYISAIFSEPELKDLIPVVSISILITPLGEQFYALAKKELEYLFISKLEIIVNIVMFVVTIYSAWILNLGVWALVIGELFRVFSRTILLVFYAFANELLPKLYFNIFEVKDYLRFGIFRTGATLSNYVYSHSAEFIIGVTIGTESLGYFNLAKRYITTIPIKIRPIFTDIVFPVFSKSKNDYEYVKKGYLKTIGILMSISAPIIFGIVVTSNTFIPIILGSEWMNLVPLFQALAVYTLVVSLGGVAGSIKKAYGKANWSFYFDFTKMIIGIPSIYLVSLTGNEVNLAIFMSVYYFLAFFMSLRFMVTKLIPVTYKEVFYELMFPIGVSFLMYFLVRGVSFIDLNLYLSLLIQIITGAIFYFGVYYLARKEYIMYLFKKVL